MTRHLARYCRYLVACGFSLFLIAGCGYQQPDGKWVPLHASAIYFAGVELGDAAIDPNYAAVCNEARDEIQAQLVKQLPEKIAPLKLDIRENKNGVSTTTAVLKITISQCEIDVEQSGGSFTYYLTLPVNVSLTRNNEAVLSYTMSTYEQVDIDTPGPVFEFTFAEPVARTLLLFDGRQVWLPDNQALPPTSPVVF